MVLPTHRTNNGSNACPIHKIDKFVIEKPDTKKQLWYHWLNIRIRQYMILEIFLIISLIVVLYKLQTITNQNNQVMEMVSSINSRMTILEGKVVSGKSRENSKKPLEQTVDDVLKNRNIEQPINDSKLSKTEELIAPPAPLNLSNNISNIPKKGLILNAADYLKGASVDISHSSRSNLNPIIGYDQTNLVLLDRPQPPTHKAWCSNEHNPVLTINLAKYIKPISVSYQHSKWTHDIPMNTPRTYDVVACLDFYCENWKPLVSNCEYSSQSNGTEQFCNISSHLNVPIIEKVQFRFKENYGDFEMTCVSLVRVYGEPKTPEHIEERNKLWREDICNRYIWYYHNIFVKNTLMNKRCSVLYKYGCCSDCPECCEQCVISDYTEHVIMAPIITIVFFFVVFLCCCYCAYRDAQRQNARQFS